MNKSIWLTLSALSILVAACASRPAARSTILAAPPPVQEAPPVEEPVEDVHLEGTRVTIDQRILFAYDSDEILADSATILDHLATFLTEHASEVPSMQVIGHTDAQGGRRHNLELSQQRAASVVAALQARGVAQALEAIGRGQAEPVCSEDTEECHEQNRRVEFLVVAAE